MKFIQPVHLSEVLTFYKIITYIIIWRKNGEDVIKMN